MARQALEPTDYPFFDYRRFTFSLGIAAAGQVWLSGSTAARFDAERKAMVVTGDLLAQASLIYDKMRKTLAADGLTLANVTRMTQYVTPAAIPDLPRLAQLRSETFGSAAPLVSTVVIKSLLRNEALIEIEGVASSGTSAPPLVVATAMGDPVAGGIAEQCRAAYVQITRALTEAGSSLDAVVKTTEFITSDALANYRHTADVRRDVFAAPYPAATGVICEKLPKPGALISVEAIAIARTA
jgi:enamine deaminase RidA (YjgF/YER057c/UK114 family)